MGINTEAPTAKLDVRVDNIENIFSIAGPAGSSQLLFTDLDATTFPTGLNTLNTKTDGMLIQTPVSANLIMKFRANDNTDGFYIINNNENPILSVNNAGNVAIGKSIAGEALDVVGNIVATGTITATSDKRYKKNISTVENALEKIMKLNGVTWEWNNPEKHGAQEGQKTSGIIAQDVEIVMPELVQTAKDDILSKSVNYDGIIGYLIEAMKQQQDEIEKLKSRLDNK